MAKHNIVTYNSASKGFETDLQDNTAQIVGSGNNVFSVQSGSTELFSVGTDNTSVTINTNLTASGDISSGSGSSTGSFGRVDLYSRLVAMASQMTNVNEIGHVSGAAQIASRISGAFDAGFQIEGDLSGSATSTGSFAKVFANHYVGDASQMTNVFISPGTISQSAQIATSISGSFNKGFIYDGEISGSVTSTGSFGRAVYAGQITGDASAVTNLNEAGFISSSAQIATSISGSFNKGFEFGGALTALQTLTASYVGVSGSAFAYAGNATTMSISSICGSDFDYRLADGITAGKIKGNSIGTGVWSAGPNRNDDQSAFAAVGTQNAYLSAGGYKAPKNGTEKYDGTAWSLSANMSIENCTAVGFGTQNAAAIAGGQGDYDGTELYNGSTYSDAGNMGKQRRYGASAGTQNAGLVFSGTSPSPAGNTDQADTETFDGNAWTEVNNMTVVRSLAGSAGTQNAAIIAGGYVHSPGANRNCTEIWNGTNWAAVANIITARRASAGIGTQNHFILAGGTTGAIVNTTEEWNGSSWSTTTSLGTARSTFAGSQGGLGTAGIVAGGQIGSPTATNTIEFWNDNSTTGSFGRVDFVGTGISGDASLMTNVPLTTGTVSGSAQLAAQISGAFQRGFLLDGTISGSMTSTASFHTINATSYVVTNKPFINTSLDQSNPISSSAQLSTAISGAFDQGFTFDGNISGSVTSTGSFGRLDAVELVGDATLITNLNFGTDAISGSAQIASDVSGSFNNGFEFTGEISGSVLSTGSFAHVFANNYVGDFSAVDAPEQGYISSSAQLATSISGAFDAGFTFGMTAAELSNFSSYVGVSGSTNAYISQGTAHVTMSINSLCGSDFDYRLDDRVVGGIKGFGGYGYGAWSAGPNKIVAASAIGAAGTQNAYLVCSVDIHHQVNISEKYDGSAWAASATLITANCAAVGFGTQNAMAIAGGQSDTNGTELYNGASLV